MGVYTDWTITARHKNFEELTQPERDALYEAVAEYCMEEFDKEGFCLAFFHTESNDAADDMDAALRDFSAEHPDVLITATYQTEWDECPNMSEFDSGEIRRYRGEVHYVLEETTPADEDPS